MRITFDNTTQVNTESAKPERITKTSYAAKATASYQVAFDGKDRVGFGLENTAKVKNVVRQPVQGAEAQVQNYRNQMTVMSHTMSDEDFAKMQEEGYDPSEMDPEEAVTILDKIKSELVKAGVHVTGYTDSMDMETLAAAVGSEVLAQAMADSFAAQDIPLEQQNVDKVVWALDMSGKISVPTESTYYYMAANEMSAVLKDFYLASASGSKVELEQSSVYFGEAVKGYVTKNVGSMNQSDAPALNMEDEVNKLMERLGVEAGATEKTVASWLIEKGLPVDADAISRMKDIFSVQFPLEPQQVVQTAASAIADGIPVEEKNLADSTSYLEKAVAVYEMYQGEDALSLVQDRLQLEEVRLRMTVETNLKLLESGFAIDTAPIEEAIEALKQAEQELAKQYFPQEADASDKYQLYKTTQTLVSDIPKLPVATIGTWSDKIATGTLEQFHAEGKALESAYQKAGERYETVWTAPRADMGDSIQKAFANVDDILADYAYEATEENRKAVRILGYNRMEITPENLERVKSATDTLEQVIRQMTPAATLKMIRDGVNPLESTLPALEQYFENLPEEYTQTSEKYSRFLYRLEHTGELTKEEKDAFIGCYRLLRQIEKSDGAAIGTLVNTGGELNFRNLLSAVRSGKFKGVDVRIDDMIGALSEEAVTKLSISEQIQTGYQQGEAAATRQQAGYQQGTESEQAVASKQQNGYQQVASGQRADFREAAHVPTEAFAMLERGEITPSVQNLLAAKALEQELGAVLARQAEGTTKKNADKEIWEKLESKEAFLEEYEGNLQDAIEKVETATIEEADSVMDVREMQLLYKQLRIMQKLTPAQEYYFPMEIGGELTGIHLQISEGEGEKGLVRITLESEKLGKLTGALQVQSNRVEGYFVGNNEEAVMNLKNSSDIVNNNLGEEWISCQIEFVYSESNHIPMDWTRKSTETQVSNDELYQLTKNFLQVVKAVGEIRSENR